MVYKKLYLRTADDYIFDIDLRGRIVVVDGLSGSGKTFLFNPIVNNQLTPVSPCPYVPLFPPSYNI